MSQYHRENPDSEECQHMERDNRMAVLVAKQMARPACLRCGRPISPDDTTPKGICDDCETDDN